MKEGCKSGTEIRRNTFWKILATIELKRGVLAIHQNQYSYQCGMRKIALKDDEDRSN